MCNKAHPEGSIAEGYLSKECMTFCSQYLIDMEIILNQREIMKSVQMNVEVYQCLKMVVDNLEEVLGKV